MKTRKAFTLIELLVVVAIIAILVAIAIPNMMSARVKANVAKSQADIRSIVNAVKTYQVDFNTIPPRLQTGSTISPTYLPRCFYLTTPVPYIDVAQGVSPFNRVDELIPHGYWYYNWDDVKTMNLNLTMAWNKPHPSEWMQWMVSTIGPSTKVYPYETLGTEGGGTSLMFIDYNPSNGLYSSGLIQTHGK
jgi:prepilin-type N-terminal cleavage/methylation domain-containing protein